MLATPSESPIVTGKETILLVDDEELVRELGMRLLSRLGYTVLPAGEGLEAVALYEEKQKEISLVILDLIMPKMGGKQCLQRLLRINPLAKILIASGFSDAAKLDELIVAGAAGFVPKPFGREELSKAVRQALDSD
jgi:CheY-like chemotaxis protein